MGIAVSDTDTPIAGGDAELQVGGIPCSTIRLCNVVAYTLARPCGPVGPFAHTDKHLSFCATELSTMATVIRRARFTTRYF